MSDFDDGDWQAEDWANDERRAREDREAERELDLQERQIKYEADVRHGRPLGLIPPLGPGGRP